MLTVLFVGILLRVRHLGRPMLHDETFTYEVFVNPGIIHTLARYDYPNNHILHSLFIYFSTLFNNSEVFIRLPAFFFSLASLIMLFAFVRRFFGVAAALFALSLSALSYSQINYAHEARGYSMNIFFTLLSAYGIFSVLRDPLGKTSSYWKMYAAGAVLSLYTVPTTLFYLVSVWAFFLPYLCRLNSRDRRVLLHDWVKYHAIMIGATLLLYAPPIVFWYFYPDRIWWLGESTPQQPIQLLMYLQQVLAYLFSPFGDGSRMAMAGTAGLAVLGLILTTHDDKKKGFLLASLLFTPAVALLFSHKIVPERTILYLQPFIFILISVFLARIQVILKNKLSSAVFTAAILAGIGLSGYKTTYAEFMSQPDLSPKITASVLNKILRPDDAYFPAYGIDNNIRYYLSDNSKDVYMRMFEYKRDKMLNAKIKNGFQKIYCVFYDAPDFEKITRIYNIDQEILRRNYNPFMLYFQSGTVKLYVAERKIFPDKP